MGTNLDFENIIYALHMQHLSKECERIRAEHARIVEKCLQEEKEYSYSSFAETLRQTFNASVIDYELLKQIDLVEMMIVAENIRAGNEVAANDAALLAVIRKFWPSFATE